MVSSWEGWYTLFFAVNGRLKQTWKKQVVKEV